MRSKCFVCDGDVVKGSENVSEVKEKGIDGLIKASTERKDNKHLNLVGLTSLLIHINCRKNYTRSDSIKKDVREASTAQYQSPKVRRSSAPAFDFKKNCVFCTHSAQEEHKVIEKRKLIHSVTTLTFHDRIKKVASARNDTWGKEVIRRLSTIIDLVAVGGVYHKQCYTEFVRPISMGKPLSEQPRDEHVTKAMDEICAFMEKSNDCQFSQEEILSAVTGIKPQWRTIKAQLQKIYKDRILISPGANRFQIPVVCFRDAGFKLLTNAWYENKAKNEADERMRIIQKAADILRQDIQSQVYSTDMYPPSDDFLKDSGAVPPSLAIFLEFLLMNKTKRVEETKRKCVAIGNAITAIVRPRTFLSPLLSSISLLLYRKYASKHLCDLLASLGFCSSYYEAQKLEMSAIQYSKPGFVIEEGVFNQFVWDNVDFNVCTIDGLNTMHAMGGIRCITPASSLGKGAGMPRLKKIPLSQETGQLAIFPLQMFQGEGASLVSIRVKHLDVREEMVQPEPHDTRGI